jgi:lysophospholipase L1-like esterase
MRYALLAGALLFVAACGSSDDPEPTTAPSPSPSSTPQTSPLEGSSQSEGRGPVPVPWLKVVPSEENRINTSLYIALGDSLSAGVGASVYEQKGFVPLVHDALGPTFALLNLGIAGDTSTQMIREGTLDRAIFEIGQRNHDDDSENDVELVTLEIGGNDLLDIFFDYVLTTGRCPNVEVGLQRQECVDQLRQALDRYEPNLDLILDRLREADPQLEIFLMTLYNPWSGGDAAYSGLAELSLEGDPATPFPEGLQDIIRRQAEVNGVHLVEIYTLFDGKANEYIASDGIHPDDTGYRVMADAVLAEMREAGTID